MTTRALGGGVGLGARDRALRAGRVPRAAAACACFALALLPVLVAVLASAGFFGTLLDRFVSDGGSAQARVDMLTVWGGVPVRQLMLAPDCVQVNTLRRIEGREWGSENWIISAVR